jgi:DNA helicase HerA-like ATPase
LNSKPSLDVVQVMENLIRDREEDDRLIHEGLSKCQHGITGACRDVLLDNNPIKVLTDFLVTQRKIRESEDFQSWRFVGYPLELNYTNATIITSDPYKIAVGGIPRNSFLIMVPANFEDFPPHFILLCVLESAPTPLSREVQQTYFELQKRSMPELDLFTQSELQWGALKTSVIGMYYPNPEEIEKIEFSGDLNNFLSAHKYELFSPDVKVLDLIINSLVPEENSFPIGKTRLTECRLPLPGKTQLQVDVKVSTRDLRGTRTALFGKTRQGKSNVAKKIAQSIIETTNEKNNVGQLIFDINGEYANDNPQDNNKSLYSVYADKCEVFAFSPRKGSNAHVLRMNFYEDPEVSHGILADLLEEQNRGSIYIQGFISAEIPTIESLDQIEDEGERQRAQRKILMYWAILKKGGFEADEKTLNGLLKRRINKSSVSKFDPSYNRRFKDALYSSCTAPQITNLDNLVNEYINISEFLRSQRGDEPILYSDSGNPLFDDEDRKLLNFLNPISGAGPSVIYPFTSYHHKNAGNIFKKIIDFIDKGKTIILDLGNANPKIMAYYSDKLCYEVFRSQMDKFTSNKLGDQFVQLYFEEAHNLFPQTDDVTNIYSRIAKEGAKYHIGMVYSTQSPSTINKDLLAQTENFFVAHISSREEVRTLSKLNVAYEDIQEDILQTKTPGYIRMLTRSHRFVVSVQTDLFLGRSA